MEVKTATESVERQRAMLTQLLLVDQPPADEDPKETTTADNELLVLVRRYGVSRDDLPNGRGRGEDHSNPVISVNHDACILCDRCVRACDDIQGNDVIGRSGKGYATRIAFDLNDPMGESTLRDVRRVRGRVPDGRAGQQADPRRADPAARGAQVGRHRVPVLRRRLRAHLPRRRGARRDLVRRGARAAGQPQPAVREGPLRLGLRRIVAAPDRAADPARGLLPQGRALGRRAGRGPRPAQARRPRRSERGHAALPRGELGGGARPRRVAAEADPRRARPAARSRASARPSARTRRPTSSRS